MHDILSMSSARELTKPIGVRRLVYFMAKNISRPDDIRSTRTYADVKTEMKYIVASIYSNYSTHVVDDTGIQQSDSYTAPPKGDKLVIRLEKREV